MPSARSFVGGVVETDAATEYRKRKGRHVFRSRNNVQSHVSDPPYDDEADREFACKTIILTARRSKLR